MNNIDDFGKIVTRIPKRVFARQWYPYSRLPYVDDIIVDVTSSQLQTDFNPEVSSKADEMFKSPYRSLKACIHGLIKYGDGSTEKVHPREYVLYHETAKMPIGKISEDDFKTQYSDNIELCNACQAKVFVQTKAVKAPQSLAEVMALLAQGKEIRLDDGTIIKSKEDLEDWARRKGIALTF